MAATPLMPEEVLRAIPHRDHALFVQDVAVDGWDVQGSSRWDRAHPHLQGHFPGLPIVPGVYLVEAAAQLGGLAIVRQEPPQAEPRFGVLAGVRRCHFHRFVRPGQRVDYRLKAAAMPGMRMYSVCGQGDVDGERSVSVDIVVAMVSRPAIEEAA